MQFPSSLKRQESEEYLEYQLRLLGVVGASKDIRRKDSAHVRQFVAGRAMRQEGNAIRCQIIDDHDHEEEVLYNRNEMRRHGIYPGDAFLRAVVIFDGESPVLWRKLKL